MSQKSYDKSASLYIVPTPIGNMEDVTFRTLFVLKSVDVIFSEDTRITLNLLNHYNIKKHLVSLYKFNEQQSSKKIFEYLSNGLNVALVSDRGTPILSDPGNLTAKNIINKGYNVISLPGSTAAIPALTSSGLDASKFLFYGFLNSKHNKRIEELNNLKKFKYTIIFYEAPHRILDMLNDLLFIFGDRNISISREISKIHEEIYRGKLSDVIKEVGEPRGEYVIICEGNRNIDTYDEISIYNHVLSYMDDGLNEKEAMKKVARDRNISKSEVYKEFKLFPGK